MASDESPGAGADAGAARHTAHHTAPKAAIIGGGVIGGGWAARFLLNGWDVAVHDPAPDAAARIEAVLATARRSLPALYDRMLPPEGRLSFALDLADATDGAAWIQESVPERLEIKQPLLAEISRLRPDAVLGSSTSGFKPSDLNATGAAAIVAHPFVPVYLLPLVELVGDPERTAKAADILAGIGMYPLTVRAEIDAHIADRFLEAVWREALWLVKDGIATTAEIDEAIRMGFGLRWAQMGLFETYRIGGGAAGMRHFLAQFGPALAWPWTKLMDVPDLTDGLVEAIATQSDSQAAGKTIADLEAERDGNLVAILRALKENGTAAGQVIARHEAQLPAPSGQDMRFDDVGLAPEEADTPSGDGAPDGLPVTLDRIIPPTWTDYNDHMNEARYLEAGAAATDRFMEMIGADAAYIAAGQSYFTVENHLTYRAELLAGERITVTTQVLGGARKKMHLFHYIHGGDGRIAATMETLLLHVDLETRRSSLPAPHVAGALGAMAEAHAALPVPEEAGRAIRRG